MVIPESNTGASRGKGTVGTDDNMQIKIMFSSRCYEKSRNEWKDYPHSGKLIIRMQMLIK